jgi:hypothetical protein
MHALKVIVWFVLATTHTGVVTQYLPSTAFGSALSNIVLMTALYPGLVRILHYFTDRQYLLLSAGVVAFAAFYKEFMGPHIPPSVSVWIVPKSSSAA